MLLNYLREATSPAPRKADEQNWRTQAPTREVASRRRRRKITAVSSAASLGRERGVQGVIVPLDWTT